MPLNEITPVQTLLASRDRPLSLRPLDALQARPAPYQALLCQPGGTLESSPRRIGNLDSTAAAPAYRALLGKATTSHADLVLTPEYSVPWSVFNDIIQGHLIPPEGALWALGFESITPVELRTLEAAMASAAQPTILLHEPLNHRQAQQKTFIDPLVYLFWAREDNTGADVLCALVQFKTVGSRDPDHVERDHLYLGTTVYKFTAATNNQMGAALLRRGVFALFMGLFARGCVSPVLISGGQQPSQRVPASFRRPAEPRNGAEHRRSVPLRRAPFWTFARRSGTVPWEGRQTCDGCDDRIPGTYIRRAPNLRPLHRSPEASPVRSGRCCLRGCQSLPLVQRSPADERERTRTGTAPAGPGVGAQAPARTSRPTQPERGCWSGRGHQRCRVLGAARARKPRRNGLRHDAGCGSGLRAARSRRLASARCRAEPAAGALLGRDAPPRDHRDRLAGTTAYALEATVVLDIIHVAAATRRAVLVAGSSKGLSAFGPRSDGRRPALSRRG